MPWFITAIATKPNGDTDIHCFGFYNEFNEAFKAVEENRGSMCECLYDYLVMEYIEPGIHPEVHKEYWWEWVEENNRWEDGIEKPEQFKGIVNFALG
jgi:hypothetical protein